MTDTRIPHDLDSEESLLGACMLSRDAVRVAAATLDVDAFYKPSHGTIFAAIRSLYSRDVGVDIVTLAAELNSHLGEVGGREHLTVLQVATPASANAQHYANIIAGHARRRRALALASELTSAIYDDDAYDRIVEQLTMPDAIVGMSTLLEADIAHVIDHPGPEVAPTILHRTDGAALIYPGRYHDLHAEPSLGKTWVMLAAAAAVLNAGGGVLILDYEDTASTCVQRLQALGVSTKRIADPYQFRYLNPSGPLHDNEIAHLHTILDALEPDLVILDALAPALALDGVDENSNSEFTSWYERTIRPITRRGAAVWAADHVVKNPAERARGGRGAGAKLAVIDGASYELLPGKAFARGRSGSAQLRIAKDRPGAIGAIGTIACDLAFHSHPDSLEITFDAHLAAPEDETTGEKRYTEAMAAISKMLEQVGTSVPVGEIHSAMSFRRETTLAALRTLVREEYIEKTGGGPTLAYRHVETFTGTVPGTDQEPFGNGTDPTNQTVPNSSQPVPGTDQGSPEQTVPTHPSPYGVGTVSRNPSPPETTNDDDQTVPTLLTVPETEQQRDTRNSAEPF